jgi:hypothetical protein
MLYLCPIIKYAMLICTSFGYFLGWGEGDTIYTFVYLFVIADVIVVALHNDVIPLHSFTGKKIYPNIGSLVRTSTVFSYHACSF